MSHAQGEREKHEEKAAWMTLFQIHPTGRSMLRQADLRPFALLTKASLSKIMSNSLLN